MVEEIVDNLHRRQEPQIMVQAVEECMARQVEGTLIPLLQTAVWRAVPES